MKLVFRDQLFSFEMLRTMRHTAYGGADIGECLATAYQIKDSDAESWYAEWRKTADRVRASADESCSGGHTVSPREAYLRAANYYRTAEVFLPVNPNDPRIGTTWERSRACFSAAAFEGRLTACILVHGLFDVYEWMMAQMPRLLRGRIAQADHPVVAMAIQAMMRLDSRRRWKFTHGIWACRASSVQAWLRLIGDYTLAGVAGKITCPTLILDSERDHCFHGQAWKVYKALSCPKTYLRFTAEEGAGAHCQVGASVVCHQRIFDWLDETLKYRVWQPPSRRSSSAV